jgi:hypothetical protein
MKGNVVKTNALALLFFLTRDRKAWWKARSLKTKGRILLGQDVLFAFAGAATLLWVWRDAMAAQFFASFYLALFVAATAVHAWRRWQALHSPLFYLAAVQHDLGGADDASRPR